MAEQVPSVGRIVHYVSYGTPGGEYASECRAAVVAGVSAAAQFGLSLAVLNPGGLFFNHGVKQDEDGKAGGTWHWPERVGG
jgi:hypothetical protein